MRKKYILKLVFLTLLSISSCSESDDSTTPLSIETNPDEVFLTQNSQVEIFIFNNDSNIPQSGTLSLSDPSLGSVVINNNNTPDNVSDDYLVYTANANTVGEDSIQYTICDASDNCSIETISLTISSLSVVNMFEGDTPHETLSLYNFFEGDLKELNPTFGVYPYDLITPLFTDYAKKKRFIWMPNGVKANYINDYSSLDFPTGSVIIKNFYYNNVQPNNSSKILETRIMFKKTSGWDFANYVWNDEQTEAFFTNQGSTVNISWLENGALKTTDYRIPSRAECFTCHNSSDNPTPIGLKPQNLNRNYDFNGEVVNQLQKLIQVGYLKPDIPNNINTVVAWDDISQPLNDRVRSYLDINCAHCHSDNGHCNYRPMRFEYHLTSDPDNIGVCVEPETQFIPNSYIVTPNNIDLSILYYRLSTTDESFRMPLLGRTTNHREGIDLIEEWINSLDNCN
ncbi:Ig-like domain-containing protein [uncultured Winogradskyella sp.]|uniref:Ig-like domain-containing protein n=1 Tax=uncultured Winogradskyella sp. TaxID=395353 RepID=UPI003519CF8E